LQKVLRQRNLRVIAIDLLGFGQAPKPADSAYSYEQHIAYIRQQLQPYVRSGQIVIIGHSMGALLAARYANAYPDDIAATVLLNPPLYASPEEAYGTLRQTSRLYRFLLDSRFRGAAWGALRTIPFGVIAAHTRQSREGSLRQVIERAELLHDLQTGSVPTLLLVGSNDRPIYMRNIQNHVLHDRVQIAVQPVAHHAPVLNTALVAGLITDFLTPFIPH
jgi:pimeloyl-ACP methyl ester carboxylesterase